MKKNQSFHDILYGMMKQEQLMKKNNIKYNNVLNTKLKNYIIKQIHKN